MTHSINNEHSLFENQYHVGANSIRPFFIQENLPIHGTNHSHIY